MARVIPVSANLARDLNEISTPLEFFTAVSSLQSYSIVDDAPTLEEVESWSEGYLQGMNEMIKGKYGGQRQSMAEMSRIFAKLMGP